MHRTSAVITCLVAAASQAQPHGGDIVLGVENGRIVTLVDGGSGLELACTYESEFGFGNLTDEPGFDSEAGTFPVGSQIGFTILRALRRWDGAGFDTIPDERIEIGWGPLTPVASPTDDTPIEGFPLGVSANGEFHYHYEFELTAPATPGIYLLDLAMWSDSPDIGASEPLSIVFNQGMDEATHEAALDWWAANGAWCTSAGCVADFNGDGLVDSRDFIAYLDAWSRRDPGADTNGDGLVDTRDFIEFLGLWSAGC